MDMNMIKMLQTATNGNPGSIDAILKIMKEDGRLAAGVMAKLILTKSHGSMVYLIYNDECARDLQKTKAMLEEWLSSTKHNGADSLGQWIIDKALPSAREAAYYLNS